MRYLLLAMIAVLLADVTSATAASRPFPVHAQYPAGCILPSASRQTLDAETDGFYDLWKRTYFHAGCAGGQAYIAIQDGKKHKEAISVSEGQGYGMILMALFAGHDPSAQASFDALYAFFRAHPSKIDQQLMAWRQMDGCVDSKDDNDSASDGDMDIAFSLLMADAQWGSKGNIDYKAEALKVIAAVQHSDLNKDLLVVMPGDWAKEEKGYVNSMRASDFMPDHFRAFSRATGDDLWNQVNDKGYALFSSLQQRFAPKSGLWPDFIVGLDANPLPARRRFLESPHDGAFSYNACRCPMRLAMDYLASGDPRPLSLLGKINAFIQPACQGDPDGIRAGYELSGKVIDADDASLAFTAPFAVAAMCSPEDQAWLDALWAQVARTKLKDDDYYGNTLKLLCMAVLSGNWWTP